MSTVDWYGNVSLVLFFAGCNIRCPYCQNAELVPIGSGTEVTLEYLDNRLKAAMTPVATIDAVVFTGGEPILQPEAVIEAAKLVKQYDLKLMLDTNGTIYDSIEKILKTGLIDRVALDVKAPLNPTDYGKAIGTTKNLEQMTSNIKKTMLLCKELKTPIEARTTIAPTISDDPIFIGKLASDLIGYSDVYYLQQFDDQGDVLNPELKNEEPPSKEHMIKLAKTAIKSGLNNVYIKTRFDGLERVQ